MPSRPGRTPRSLHAARKELERRAAIRLAGKAKFLKAAFLEGQKHGLEIALKLLSTVERIEPKARVSQ